MRRPDSQCVLSPRAAVEVHTFYHSPSPTSNLVQYAALGPDQSSALEPSGASQPAPAGTRGGGGGGGPFALFVCLAFVI